MIYPAPALSPLPPTPPPPPTQPPDCPPSSPRAPAGMPTQAKATSVAAQITVLVVSGKLQSQLNMLQPGTPVAINTVTTTTQNTMP